MLLSGGFTARYPLRAFILWFLNGYFWHAVFSDIERLRTSKRIIIRRREPPLPHDSCKWEIE